MVGPVADQRQFAGQGRQPAGEKIAERLAAGVDVGAVPVNEVHRHIEHIVDIALEPEAILEDEGQDAGAVAPVS